MGCHYFLITGQVSPCHYNKLRQTVAQKKKKNIESFDSNMHNLPTRSEVL